MSRIHAFRDDALADHDAVGLTHALHAGEVSVPEVVEAAIARTSAVDPELGAVAFEAFDRARAEARDPRGGFFAGVPTFVKDNSDVAGMPSMHGTDAWDPHPATRDGDFARMFLATGLVPLGKTRMSEYGFSASAEHPRQGPVRNPWDPAYTAGASSSGSAALVAAGAVPIAHANDGGGSIRIPAAANGLVGLKPTRDRLAQDKLFTQMPLRIVADGVVTRSVRDTAAFLREAEKVWRNPALAPVGDVTRPGRRRLRIALVTQSVGRPTSPEVVEQVRAVAGLLEDLGHRVSEVEAPVTEQFVDDFLVYWSLLSSATVLTGRHDHGRSFDRTRLDNLTIGLDRHFKTNLRRFPGALRRLRALARSNAEFHAQHDVVLSPTLATATPRIGVLDPTQPFETIMDRLLDWVAFTPLQNANGAPSMSLPLTTSSNGMPLGTMFSADAGREAVLLELGLELEEALGLIAPISSPAVAG